MTWLAGESIVCAINDALSGDVRFRTLPRQPSAGMAGGLRCGTRTAATAASATVRASGNIKRRAPVIGIDDEACRETVVFLRVRRTRYERWPTGTRLKWSSSFSGS
jgi:hypothetical protein